MPPFSPGAHIDVHLPGQLIRQYSLCNEAGADHYQIGVLRDAHSRGGSAAVHDQLRVGDAVHISAPKKNHFELLPAPHTMLFAGGIGITPLLCMARNLASAGSSFELHYCARSAWRRPADGRPRAAGQAATVDAAVRVWPVRIYRARVRNGDFAGVGARSNPRRAFRCTGETANGWHGIRGQLASSGARIRIPPDRTVLQVLRERGIDIPSSCEQGGCGSCITLVVSPTIGTSISLMRSTPEMTVLRLAARGRIRPRCCSTCSLPRRRGGAAPARSFALHFWHVPFLTSPMKPLFAIAALSILTNACAQPADNSIEARIGRVESGLLPASAAPGTPPSTMRLAERMAALKVPGVSVAVINHGVIEWARGYGMADVASGRAVTDRTRFQAGSISKPVTAMAVLSLVQAGKLSLDEDVNQSLKTWTLPDNAYTARRKVSLRDLLSHTAGIGVHGYTGYAAGQPIPSLLQLLDGKPPANSAPVRVEASPGSAWQYSGGGYEIVQLLLTEHVTEPFDLFVQHAVLDRIGMNDSRYALPAAWEAEASSAYLADGSMVPGKWHRYPELAAAALWSTPSDLARFAIEIQNSRAGRSNKVLSQAMTQAMLTPGIETFGLGLFLGEKTDAHASFRHSGGNEGFRNMLFAYDETGQGAVVMTNSDNGAELIEEVLRAIAREYGWDKYLVASATAAK